MSDWYQDAAEFLIPTYNRLPIHFVKGEGVYLTDGEGEVYLDALAGIAVNALGYKHPRLVAAARAQSVEVAHVSNLFQIENQYKLAKKLSELGFDSAAFFCNSGAEANEAAFKFARKYSQREGNGGRTILSFENSFHGRTFGALTATGQEKYRRGFEPLPEGFEYVPYNDIEAVEKRIVSNPDVCALVMELVQGEGGVVPVDRDFLVAVRQLCDDNRVLLIFDEVQTGVGRSGAYFCYQKYGVEPDLVTLAKGLGGGYPIGALLVRQGLREGLQPGEHASTFGGNPFVCAMALTVLDTIGSEKLLENVNARSVQLKQGLKKLSEKYEPVVAPRGIGLMLGLPLADSLDAAEIMNKSRRQGLIVGTAGDNCLRFVPPLIITEEETEILLNRLDLTLQKSC